MTDEQRQDGDDKPQRSTAPARHTMGMRRISSRPGGRKAPILLTIIVLLAIAIAVLLTLLPGRAKGKVTAFPPLGDGEAAVLFLGDVLLGNTAWDTLEREGYDLPFGDLAPLIASADAAAVVINHEGPITERTQREGTNPRASYSASPRSAEALARAGITHASLANNHALDRGIEGLLDTRRHLEGDGIVPFGAGAHRDAALRPVIIEAGDTTVAVVAAMQRWRKYREAGWGATEDHGGVAYLDQATLPDLFPPAGAEPDVVVAFVHWGVEYEPVADRTRATAAKLANRGVDVVIGHHSHVPQAIGKIGDVPVLYGLGNAAFGSRGRFERGEGVGLVARLVTAGGAVQRIELIAVRTDNRRVDFATAAMGPRESARVLQRLADEGPVELRVVDGIGVLEV